MQEKTARRLLRVALPTSKLLTTNHLETSHDL